MCPVHLGSLIAGLELELNYRLVVNVLLELGLTRMLRGETTHPWQSWGGLIGLGDCWEVMLQEARLLKGMTCLSESLFYYLWKR